MKYAYEKIFYNEREAEDFAIAHNGKIRWTRDENGVYTYYVRFN